MALPSATDIEYVGTSSSGGCVLGQTSTDLIGFFGLATAIAQPSGAGQAAVSTAAATSGSAIYGFTSAQANGIVTLVNQLRSDLVALGILKGS